MVETGDSNNKTATVYSYMNNMLRFSDIWKYGLLETKLTWCYKYIGTLYKHLSKIKCRRNKLYRGCNVKLEGRIGDKITFKNYLSTSMLRNVALAFAVNGKKKAEKKQQQSKRAVRLS